MAPQRATERDPLLGNESASEQGGPEAKVQSTGVVSPFRRLVLCALLSWLAFVFTQTPLLYAIHELSCEDYYRAKANAPTALDVDRCSNHRAIEAMSARAISLMITFTTIGGMLNLFTAQWLIRKRGIRFSMFFQTAFPCLRNLCQTFAVTTRGPAAIYILQWTQLITIVGGGGGFVLCANSYLNHLVPADERTSSFGILQGAGMLASAFSFTAGGLISDHFGIAAPFVTTLVFLMASTIISSLFLPYVPPDSSKDKKGAGIFSAVHALKIFTKRRLATDALVTEEKSYFGLTMLALGSFLSILATMFVPVMLQLTGTSLFGFKPTQNGVLMSINSLVKGIFLTMIFPRIIKRGRARYAILDAAPLPKEPSDDLPTRPENIEPIDASDPAHEPAQPPKPTDAAHGSRFDLAFLKASTLIDALLTAPVSLATKGEHLYLAAAVLPFASGTASAAKGVVTELVPKEEQQEALAGISLIETTGMITTVSFFGWIFSMLSDIDKPQLVFALNGAVALLGTFVLIFVRFPERKILPLASS